LPSLRRGLVLECGAPIPTHAGAVQSSFNAASARERSGIQYAGVSKSLRLQEGAAHGAGERLSRLVGGERGLICCNLQDCSHTAANVEVRRCPRRHADSHCFAPFPNGAATPTGSICLHSIDHPSVDFVVSEGHPHLVQHNVVKNFTTSGAKGICEGCSMLTATVDEVDHTLFSEGTQCRPDFHCSRATRRFRPELHWLP